MACTRPLKGYRDETGKLVFKSGNSEGTLVEVSCGQCISCRLKRVRDWAIRCRHESYCHERSSFLTLTYNNSNLPSDGSISVNEWQLFANRLRKAYGPFRYFMCGEYGDRRLRPHYHALVFGHDFAEERKKWKISKSGALFVSSKLEDVWNRGFVTIGAVEFDSAAYVARYAMKKIRGDLADTHYDGRKPEFSTMSLRPAIAKDWFKENWRDVYPADSVIVKGFPVTPPVAYDRWMEEIDPEMLDYVKKRRQEKGKNFNDGLGEDKERRLRDREKNLEDSQSLSGVNPWL